MQIVVIAAATPFLRNRAIGMQIIYPTTAVESPERWKCVNWLELSTWSVAPRDEIEISELLSLEVIIATSYRVSQVRDFSRSYLIIFTHTNHCQSRIVDFRVTSLLSAVAQ